jgi:hypothetical protein
MVSFNGIGKLKVLNRVRLLTWEHRT